MRKLSMQEIRELEINLLNEFVKLCQNNNLYYTLCGGTLLGAIRHKGFIPWDDDIDILMPRPDYDRLLNAVNIDFSSLPSYMQICHWKNGNLKFPFIKLCDMRTQITVDYFDESYAGDKIWIDIFPIDGNPENRIALKYIFWKVRKWRKILCLKLAKSGEGRTKAKRFVKPFLKKLLKLLNYRRLCKKIDSLSSCYSFENSRYIGGILWGYGPQERIHKQEYLTPVKVEFEGYYFNAPSNYDEYLTGLYQDYMKLPPEEQRQTHGITAYLTETDLQAL